MKAIVQDRYGDVDALQLRDIAEPHLEDERGADPGQGRAQIPVCGT